MARKIVRVPKPPDTPYRDDSPLSREGLTLIANWHEAEKTLPPDQQTGIDVQSIKTHAQANEYMRALVARSLPKAASQRLSLARLAGVALAALAILALVTYGLVWLAKQISSIPLLILIICADLLFFLILAAIVLLISGYLSEKLAEKLIAGVLGKIPGLDRWLPKGGAQRPS